ncbi:hydroxysqualene dehydroxylase [Demequina sp. SO4-13]|uniref:hydroxysqualene dehydroxylase n=1 Tax=Demequina sp. SO4-13 TaxID=3401027 RepID=UPI003AF757A4
MSTPQRIIVVGAGLAGLTTAVRLVDAGHEVTVLESAGVVGGRTADWDEDGMQVETGLHRYLGFYTKLPRLLRHVGLKVSDVVVWRDEIAFRVADGGPSALFSASLIRHPVRTAVRALKHRDFLPLRQRGAMVRMLAAGSVAYLLRPTKLDQVPIADYARGHGVSQQTVDRLIAPLTAGLFFVPPDKFSAHNLMGVVVPYWRSLIKTGVGAFSGGMTEVMSGPIAEYVRKKGGTVHVNTRVQSLVGDANGITGVRVHDKVLEADQVVVATSLGPAKALIDSALEGHEWFDDMRRMESTPSVCFQAETDVPSTAEDTATFTPGTEMGCFAEQSRTTFSHLDGRISVIMATPKTHADSTTEELTETVITEARRVGVDLRGHIRRARKVGISDDFYSLECGNDPLRPAQHTPIPGLTLAGDYTQQKYLATMEGAVQSGELAARAILKEER